MKKKRKVPFSWKVEEYAFGAVALRDEIKRHKEDDKEPWGLAKTVGIRLLYMYALIVALVFIGIGIVWQIIQDFNN